MNTLKKNLEQREKSELIAIIQHMLGQEPDLQWLLMTPLPTASAQKSSVDPKVYRQQILAAINGIKPATQPSAVQETQASLNRRGVLGEKHPQRFRSREAEEQRIFSPCHCPRMTL